MTLRKERLVINSTTGVNPINIQLSENLPGRIEKIDLIHWELYGVTAPVINTHFQIGFSDTSTQSIVSGCNPALVQVPYMGAGNPWNGPALKIPIRVPKNRFNRTIISVYGEGVSPTLVSGVGLIMTFWFDLYINSGTGGDSWSVNAGEVMV